MLSLHGRLQGILLFLALHLHQRESFGLLFVLPLCLQLKVFLEGRLLSLLSGRTFGLHVLHLHLHLQTHQHYTCLRSLASHMYRTIETQGLRTVPMGWENDYLLDLLCDLLLSIQPACLKRLLLCLHGAHLNLSLHAELHLLTGEPICLGLFL